MMVLKPVDPVVWLLYAFHIQYWENSDDTAHLIIFYCIFYSTTWIFAECSFTCSIFWCFSFKFSFTVPVLGYFWAALFPVMDLHNDTENKDRIRDIFLSLRSIANVVTSWGFQCY